MSTAVDEFPSRIPHFELDPDAPQFWTQGQVQGMSRVPIRFKPRKTVLPTRGKAVDAWLEHAKRA